MQCKNYRPITLLSVAYEIFATSLCKKLTEMMEGKLGEYQMGFRPDKSTIGNTFKLKTKLRGLSPHANYTDRAAAAGRRS